MADASELFNYLTGYSNQTDYRELLVAPVALRRRFGKLVAREMGHARRGQPARIIIKCNALTDPRIVRLLYRASQAGVTIDLIIRGVCALRPGVPGISENITVRSIVGRFLEHSRIWYFENDGDAGGLHRQRRPDGAQPEQARRGRLPDPRSRAERSSCGTSILEAYLRDNVRARILQPDGSYEPVEREGRRSTRSTR